MQHTQSGRWPYTNNDLKKRVYGSLNVGMKEMKDRGVEASKRIVRDLSRLRTDFPNGFGMLERELRNWR